MNKFVQILCVCLAITSMNAVAQAQADEILKSLHIAHEKEIAAVVQPVHERYKATLEKLLSAETEKGNQQAVAKIRADLQKLEISMAALGPAVLSTRVQGSAWQHVEGKKFYLDNDGSTRISWSGRKGTWRMNGPNQIWLDIWNSPRPEIAKINADGTEITWPDGVVSKRILTEDKGKKVKPEPPSGNKALFGNP